MPWTPADAQRHTKAVGQAAGGAPSRQWAHVVNGELAAGKSEGEAVMIANGVAKKRASGEAKTTGTGNPYRKGLRGIGI